MASMGERGHMSRAQLAQAFVRLADTLVPDLDLVEHFDLLAHTLVDCCGAAAAGVLLADARGRLRVVASSSERTRTIELLELQTDEGPCLDAFHTGALVTAATHQEQVCRWPNLMSRVGDAWAGPAYGIPMQRGEQRIGAVNIFGEAGGPIPGDALATARALVDVATIATVQARRNVANLKLNEELQAALDSRVRIEQAKGMLAAHGALEMQEAFSRLRGYARSNNRHLSEVAEEVANGTLHPRHLLDP